MATKGMKTKMEYGNQPTHQASTTWTAFATVTEIVPPQIGGDDIDTTHLDSPDNFREWEPGLADAGECSLKIQFSATQNATVYSLFQVSKGFRIVFADAVYPSGSKWLFNGYIKQFQNESIGAGGIVTAEIVVKVVGKPAFSAAA